MRRQDTTPSGSAGGSRIAGQAAAASPAAPAPGDRARSRARHRARSRAGHRARHRARHRAGHRKATGDLGFAAVFVLALAGVLVACAGVSVAMASIAVARQRAASGADLAALSAALHARQGAPAACAAARRTALEQQTVLTACRLEGLDAVVEVSARPAPALVRFGTAVGRARAGPAPLPFEQPRRLPVR